MSLEVSLTRSQFAERMLVIDAKPFSFANYPMFRDIYDAHGGSMVLMTCRQVGKSTTLSNIAITESIALKPFKTMFVAPSSEQSHKFSTLRVGKTLTFSENIRKYFSTEKAENRVSLRMFSGGSEIAFSYAKDDADRCRGYSADHVCLDEIQDMLLDAVEPVILQCMANSKYKWVTRCGTPKTLDNPVQDYWEKSTQNEWVVRCEGCNKFNFLRSEKNIGKFGPICLVCGHYLNPRNGQWVSLNPTSKITGYHVSRIMMPQDVPACWNTGTADYDQAIKNWMEILNYYSGPKRYSPTLFKNEVLGVSDSVGRRLITKDLLKKCCTGPYLSPGPNNTNMADITHVAAGVDWSGGGTNELSRTVLWILGRTTKRTYRTLFYKIFPGLHPIEEVTEIASILKKFPTCNWINCDRGEGNMPTEMLKHLVGLMGPKKVYKINYGAPKFHIGWDPIANHYLVNRTWAIDAMMMTLQRQEIQFSSNVDSMMPAFEDFLAEFEEVTKRGYKVWRHSPLAPDDCLHALVFAMLGIQLQANELDLTSKINPEDYQNGFMTKN